MKTNMELFQERMGRIQTALNLETPDRVPLVFMADSFCANQQGVKLSEFCTNPELANRTVIQSLTSLGEFDGVLLPISNNAVFSFIWLSNMKIPGRDLPEGSLWQCDEASLMTVEDYDTIIAKGFNPWRAEYLSTRLRDKAILPQVGAAFGFLPQAIHNCIDAGIGVMAPGYAGIPFDAFCGGRSLANFMSDLRKIPDKVQAAMDVFMAETIAELRQIIRHAHPMAIWVDGMRGASGMVSPKIWHRFVWPYYRQLVEAIHEEGSKAYLHFDGDWERDLEFFKELPRASAVFASDHGTDLYKVREMLDDHLCIMGDVPATMLAIGNPDEVHAYCTKLIRDLGPKGFILSQGCDLPPNSKPENVAAIMAAASGQ